MSIQNGFDDLDAYFAPINKGINRVFLGSKEEESVIDEPVFEEYDDTNDFITEEYDTTDLEEEPVEETLEE